MTVEELIAKYSEIAKQDEEWYGHEEGYTHEDAFDHYQQLYFELENLVQEYIKGDK